MRVSPTTSTVPSVLPITAARQLHPVAALGDLDRIDVEWQSRDAGRFMGDADRRGLEGEFRAVGQLNDAATGRLHRHGRAVLADDGESALGADPDHRRIDQPVARFRCPYRAKLGYDTGDVLFEIER